MDTNKLGQLVAAAKGEDRSMRKYAEDSGVDVAVIQKIISGKYTPKKPDVFYKLTDENAAPRGGVTATDLIRAAGVSRDYQKGVDAGIETTLVNVTGILAKLYSNTVSEVLGASLELLTDMFIDDVAAGGRRGNKKVGNKETASRLLTEQPIRYGANAMYSDEGRRFAAFAEGLVYRQMASKGIVVVPKETVTVFLTEMMVKDMPIKEYHLRYIFVPKAYSDDEEGVRFALVKMLSALSLSPLMPERKISFVTNSEMTYDMLLGYRGNLSFRGNLSAILTNMEQFRLEKEEYLVHYDEPDATGEMLIL